MKFPIFPRKYDTMGSRRKHAGTNHTQINLVRKSKIKKKTQTKLSEQYESSRPDKLSNKDIQR